MSHTGGKGFALQLSRDPTNLGGSWRLSEVRGPGIPNLLLELPCRREACGGSIPSVIPLQY
jgi:hypothetical protein